MNKVSTNLGEIDNPFGSHENLYDSLEDANLAIKGILRVLFSPSEGSDEENEPLRFRGIETRFSDEEPAIPVEFDFIGKKIIFHYKKPETAEEKNKIKESNRMMALQSFLDIQARFANTTYKAIGPEGRKKVIEAEKERELEKISNDS